MTAEPVTRKIRFWSLASTSADLDVHAGETLSMLAPKIADLVFGKRPPPGCRPRLEFLNKEKKMAPETRVDDIPVDVTDIFVVRQRLPASWCEDRQYTEFRYDYVKRYERRCQVRVVCCFADGKAVYLNRDLNLTKFSKDPPTRGEWEVMRMDRGYINEYIDDFTRSNEYPWAPQTILMASDEVLVLWNNDTPLFWVPRCALENGPILAHEDLPEEKRFRAWETTSCPSNVTDCEAALKAKMSKTNLEEEVGRAEERAEARMKAGTSKAPKANELFPPVESQGFNVKSRSSDFADKLFDEFDRISRDPRCDDREGTQGDEQEPICQRLAKARDVLDRKDAAYAEKHLFKAKRHSNHVILMVRGLLYSHLAWPCQEWSFEQRKAALRLAAETLLIELPPFFVAEIRAACAICAEELLWTIQVHPERKTQTMRNGGLFFECEDADEKQFSQKCLMYTVNAWQQAADAAERCHLKDLAKVYLTLARCRSLEERRYLLTRGLDEKLKSPVATRAQLQQTADVLHPPHSEGLSAEKDAGQPDKLTVEEWRRWEEEPSSYQQEEWRPWYWNQQRKEEPSSFQQEEWRPWYWHQQQEEEPSTQQQEEWPHWHWYQQWEEEPSSYRQEEWRPWYWHQQWDQEPSSYQQQEPSSHEQAEERQRREEEAEAKPQTEEQGEEEEAKRQAEETEKMALQMEEEWASEMRKLKEQAEELAKALRTGAQNEIQRAAQQLKSEKKLELQIPSGAETLLALVMKELTDLEKLILDVQSDKISREERGTLASALEQLPHLETLQVRFGGAQLGCSSAADKDKVDKVKWNNTIGALDCSCSFDDSAARPCRFFKGGKCPQQAKCRFCHMCSKNLNPRRRKQRNRQSFESMVRGSQPKLLLPDTVGLLFDAETKLTQVLLKRRWDSVCEVREVLLRRSKEVTGQGQESPAWQRYHNQLFMWFSAKQNEKNQIQREMLSEAWARLQTVQDIDDTLPKNWKEDSFLRVSCRLVSCSLAWPSSRCRAFKDRLQHLVPAADLAGREGGDQFAASEFSAACALCAMETLWMIRAKKAHEVPEAIPVLLGRHQARSEEQLTKLLEEYANSAWKKAANLVKAAFGDVGAKLREEYDYMARCCGPEIPAVETMVGPPPGLG
ncbi:unnamed protein product [Symbiodinium sp. CCMP2592]|nr:unnamed protein product [Symbiodinium sp. CCMP2592]